MNEQDRIAQLEDEIERLRKVSGVQHDLKIMAEARTYALEEAAKVADEYQGFVRAELVAAIRALAKKEAT